MSDHSPPLRAPLGLRSLGRTTLVDSSGGTVDAVLANTKAFALLAYLSAEPGVFQSRDLFKALLWPDRDEARAANSLRVALHALRSALGKGVIVTRGDRALAVDPELLDSDVARLREALGAGDWSGALELYGGRFLRGFHVDGCSEYMLWVGRTTAELERSTVTLVLDRGEELLEEGDVASAALAASGALRIRRLDERALRLRVHALTGSGRRGRALEEAEAFVTSFEAEFEAPPSPETLETIRRAREERRPPSSEATGPEGEEEPEPAAGAEAPSPDEGTPPVPAEPVEAGGPVTVRRPRRWTRPRAAFLVLPLLVLPLLGLLGWALVGGRPDTGPPPVPSAAAVAGVSEGRALFHRGAYEEAAEHFRAATESDPEYGEAFYHLALAAYWAGWQEVAARALERATELGPAMEPRLRRLTSALAEPLGAREVYRELLAADSTDLDALLQLGELEFHWGPTLGVPAEDAREEFQALLRLVPDHHEALVHLARLDAMRGDAAGMRRALERIDPGALSELDRVTLDALAAILDPGAPLPLDAVTGLPGDEPGGVMAAAASVRVLPDRVDAFLGELAGSELSPALLLEARLWNAVAMMARGRPSAAAEWLEGVGEISPARRDEFAAYFAMLPFLPFTPEAWARYRDRLDAYADGPLIGPTRFDLARRSAIYAHRRVFLGYLTEVPGLETDLTFPAFDAEVQQTVMDTAFAGSFKRYLEARALFMVTTRPGRALEALGPPRLAPDRVYPGLVSYPMAFERHLRASLRRQAGHVDEALGWYHSFPDPRGYDRAFLPAILVDRGAVELQAGDPAAARESLRGALDFLKDAEPRFEPLRRLGMELLSRAGG